MVVASHHMRERKWFAHESVDRIVRACGPAHYGFHFIINARERLDPCVQRWARSPSSQILTRRLRTHHRCWRRASASGFPSISLEFPSPATRLAPCSSSASCGRRRLHPAHSNSCGRRRFHPAHSNLPGLSCTRRHTRPVLLSPAPLLLFHFHLDHQRSFDSGCGWWVADPARGHGSITLYCLLLLQG